MSLTSSKAYEPASRPVAWIVFPELPGYEEPFARPLSKQLCLLQLLDDLSLKIWRDLLDLLLGIRVQGGILGHIEYESLDIHLAEIFE